MEAEGDSLRDGATDWCVYNTPLVVVGWRRRWEHRRWGPLRGTTDGRTVAVEFSTTGGGRMAVVAHYGVAAPKTHVVDDDAPSGNAANCL